MSVVTTRALIFGGACAVGGAATALGLRGRPEAPVLATPSPFTPRAVEPSGPAVPMSPSQLDAALLAAFPGDETPGYL